MNTQIIIDTRNYRLAKNKFFHCCSVKTSRLILPIDSIPVNIIIKEPVIIIIIGEPVIEFVGLFIISR